MRGRRQRHIPVSAFNGSRDIEGYIARLEENLVVCLLQGGFFKVTRRYEPLHQQLNKFWAVLDSQSESEKISLAAKKFDITRDQVREILGIKDLIQFTDAVD